MKIPLKVQIVAGGPKPVLYAHIRVSQFRIFGATRFVVDTGSSQTSISERDALKMQIPFNRIGEFRPLYGIGGSALNAYPMKKVVFTFRNDRGKLIHKTHPVVYACRTAKRGQIPLAVSLALPNILGVDFLIEHRYRLVFDPSNQTASMEDV